MSNVARGRIRPAGRADRDGIAQLARASGLFGDGGLDEVDATFASFLAGSAGEDRWLTADAAPGVAAVAYYAPERMTDGIWNLLLLAVHPDPGGQGWGSALVAYVEEDLRSAGARVLLIETSGVAEFARQRAFYVRLGYRQEARISDFYGQGDDKVVYWKSLVDTVASDR